MLLKMFVDMLQLLGALVATQTDYAQLRRVLAGNDCLLFMRDALLKMSIELNSIALEVSRAIEYEIEQLKQQGLNECEPETLALIIQVLRRMRNAARIVGKLAGQTSAAPDTPRTSILRIDKSLGRFLSRQQIRLGLLTINLRLDLPHFRYAVRVTLATAIAMTLGSQWLSPAMAAHSYWVMLTIIIIWRARICILPSAIFPRRFIA